MKWPKRRSPKAKKGMAVKRAVKKVLSKKVPIAPVKKPVVPKKPVFVKGCAECDKELAEGKKGFIRRD